MNKISHCLSLLGFLLIAVSCQEDANKPATEFESPHQILISGQVTTQDSIQLDKVSIYGYDLENRAAIQQDAALDEQGNFSLSLEQDQAMSFTLYANSAIDLLAAPGDRIYVSFKEGDEPEVLENSLTFKGSNAVTQEQLRKFEEGFPLRMEDFYSANLDLTYQDLQQQIETKKAAIEAYYDSFYADPNTSLLLADFLKARQKYGLINTKMDYLSYANYYDKPVPDLESDYFKPMEQMPELRESDLVNNFVVNEALRSYASYTHKVLDLLHPGATEAELDQFMLTKAAERKNSLFHQHVVAMMVMRDFDNHSIKIYEENQEQVEKALAQTELLTTIQEQYQKTKLLLEDPNLPEGAELLTFKTSDPAQYLDEIIKNADGKVIYIDNWATWCGPCKAEFKEASPKLHERFKEDVEFVYLCHASKKSAYEPSIAEYGIKGKHYFLNDEEAAVVQEQIELEGFPTYTIYNKKGERVLSDYIHRPSHGPTTALLTELVNE